MKKWNTQSIRDRLATKKMRWIAFGITTAIFGLSALWLFLTGQNNQLITYDAGWESWLNLLVFVLPLLISIAVSEWYQGFFLTKNDVIEIWKLTLGAIAIPVIGHLPDVNTALAAICDIDAAVLAMWEYAIPLAFIYLLSIPFILFKFKYTPPPEPVISDEEHRRMLREKYEMFVEAPPPPEVDTDAYGRPF